MELVIISASRDLTETRLASKTNLGTTNLRRFFPYTEIKYMSLMRIEELISEMRTQIRRIKAGENQELLEVLYKFYPQDRKPCFR